MKCPKCGSDVPKFWAYRDGTQGCETCDRIWFRGAPSTTVDPCAPKEDRMSRALRLAQEAHEAGIVTTPRKLLNVLIDALRPEVHVRTDPLNSKGLLVWFKSEEKKEVKP